ncbi:MAG: hypothetical protein KKI08_04790, partial [Armatimonadetes bacterium]|nr:hypothetical protein [Armatimonadota bacterium]
YLSEAGPFTAEDENCLSDGRLGGGRGAAGSAGAFVRYRNLLLRIMMGTVGEAPSNRPKMDAELWQRACNGAERYQTALVAKLAVQWLDKVAGPDRADLWVDKNKVCLRLWKANPLVEREPAADQQYVAVEVNNRSQKVTAVGAEVRLSVAKPGDAEMQPIGRPVRLPDIRPGGRQIAVCTWDLGGKNVEDALLRAEVGIPGVEDADPTDNRCDIKCSIYYAHNGKTAYRWVEDSYSFDNYACGGRETQEMVEGILATAVNQLYTDPQAVAVLTRLIFPQTYMRLQRYLEKSMECGAGGHCYGMAATAGAYFVDGSLRPAGGRTADLSQDAASANINIYQRAQMVPLAAAVLTGRTTLDDTYGPLKSLNIVRGRLKTERKPVMLVVYGTERTDQLVTVNGVQQHQPVEESWAHALLAYKLVEVEGIYSGVYVYDPNIPPMGERNSHNPSTAVAIHPVAGTWGLPPNMLPLYPGIDGVGVENVRREVPLAEANALVAAVKAKLAEMRSWFDKADKIMAVLRCPADALFTDPQGRRVGMVNGKPVNEVSGAEIRSQGEVEIYVLPRSVPFTVQVTGTGTGQAALDLLRSRGGAPEVVVFDRLPVTAGAKLQGSLAKGGVLERLTGGDGRSYVPTLVGSLQGDKVTWQGGSQAGPGPTTGPTTGPTAGQAVEIIICESAPGGQPQNIATEFTAPKTVTALVKYTQLPANTTVRWVWTRDNLPRAELTKVLSGTGWQSHSLTSPLPLTPGRYHLSLLVNGKSAAERDVTVRAAGSTTTPTMPTTTPATTLPPSQTLTLTGPSSVGVLARRYDRNRFGVKLAVTWTKPGAILDTVGINAAPVGSFTVAVDGTGKLHLQVYAPAASSPHKQSNGWHVLPSPVVARAGQPCEVTLTYEKGQWGLRVSAGGQQQTVTLALPVPLSGQPIYVGDFPGDNNWPATLNPHRGMTGTVGIINIIGRTE